MLNWQENVILAPHTTIRLGGPARFFVSVKSADTLREALREAGEKNLRVHILGGGSNTVFADNGFDGLVIKIDLKGVEFVDSGGDVLVMAQAGEVWERLAAETVRRNLAGFECLAGIPGQVGGTPVQNVGAYGQEVAQTIVEVAAVDRRTLAPVRLTNAECGFSYRMSRFKADDADRFVIVAVTYRLKKNGEPCLEYQQVRDKAGERAGLKSVREIVLSLRKAKSMVIDPRDSNTRSCGSFFMNPTLEMAHLEKLQRWADEHNQGKAPFFMAGGKVLVPAAWLVERAGFAKGLRRDGVGISDNHPLALVNYGGTSATLLALAGDIQRAVQDKFGISLIREPVVV